MFKSTITVIALALSLSTYAEFSSDLNAPEHEVIQQESSQTTIELPSQNDEK